MEHELKRLAGQALPVKSGIGGAGHPYDLQCLRILRCTAKAMAEGPGGLRFKAGTRPWLDGLTLGRQPEGAVSADLD